MARAVVLFGGSPLGGGSVPNSGPARPVGVPITIGPDDYQAFERRLVESQAAYSNGDVAGLRRVATAEMAGNFEQELTSNERQGVVNKISDVHLVSGDLSEAWREGGTDYATVAMRFSLVDVTIEKTIEPGRLRQCECAADRDGGLDLRAPVGGAAAILGTLGHTAGLKHSRDRGVIWRGVLA